LGDGGSSEKLGAQDWVRALGAGNKVQGTRCTGRRAQGKELMALGS
jgi:hypothetical protein